MPDAITVRPVVWDSPDAALVRGIRFRVFVDEQKVPAEEEIDVLDPAAFHVLAVDAGDEPLGTGRLYSDTADGLLCHIGRMAVLASARRRGVGAAIMEALLAEAQRRGFRRAVLSAQVHAIPFYEKFGFAAYGPEYLDVNIPHRDMARGL